MGIAVYFKWHILEAVPFFYTSLEVKKSILLNPCMPIQEMSRYAHNIGNGGLLAAKCGAMRIMRCIVTTAIMSLAAIPVLMLSL